MADHLEAAAGVVEIPTFVFVCICVVFVCLVGLLVLALMDGRS